MNGLAAERDRIVSGYRDIAAGLGADAPAWLPPVREAAIESFAEIGFPSRKREDWKYTNVTPIAAVESFITARPGRTSPVPARAVALRARAGCRTGDRSRHLPARRRDYRISLERNDYGLPDL